MGGLKGLTFFKGKTGGRNSSGRITSFHRGGGAKRLQRKMDMKRNVPSMGVVERVEYDPNRSARIALVRWMSPMQEPLRNKKGDGPPKPKPAPPRMTIDPSTVEPRGTFSFSSLPGIRIIDNNQWNKVHPKEVFHSALTTPRRDGKPSLLQLPRIAFAGANPAFVAVRVARQFTSEDASPLYEVRKVIQRDSRAWARRTRPEEAVMWDKDRLQKSFGIVAPQEKPKANKTTYIRVDGR